MSEIIDIVEVNVPGETGDVTPEAEAAAAAAAASAASAAASEASAATSATTAKNEADRSEAAAASIDMSAINQRLDDMQALADGAVQAPTPAPTDGSLLAFDAATGKYKPVAPADVTARSQVKYVHGAAYQYSVITVTGRNAIRKVLAPGFLTDGTGRVPRVNRANIKSLARAAGVGTIVNCDAGINLDDTYAATQGINIAGGVPYNGFDGAHNPGITGVGVEALARYPDGKLRPIYASDGKTAAQYVAEGVLDTYGYGPIVVANGIDTKWYSKPIFTTWADAVSARTILGQDAAGRYLLITVHGVSGQYGIKGKQLSDIALAEGCVVAVNLDGGGTTQGVYDGMYHHPSSDALGYRVALHAIAVDAAPTNVFDTGDITIAPAAGITAYSAARPALSIRCVGSDVALQVNVSDATPFAQNAWRKVTGEAIPNWMKPLTDQESRGQLASTQGNFLGASVSTDFELSVRNNTAVTMNVCSGQMRWPLRNAYPAQP